MARTDRKTPLASYTLESLANVIEAGG